MGSENWERLKVVFQAALELEPPAARSAYLDEACADDPGLRAQVEKLLASHDGGGEFLEAPAVVDLGVVEATERETAQPVGKRIGPYQITREIGHGGMGTVYLAVRADDQYKKQVAIKLVNRGMDTEIILRRFTMERQILANLEHPNIARLLEGGSTPDGLPYFVMEYIEGEPINEYCDARRFSTAERLELFREVCGALQYAHQNLVVHRDIKPSNILVTADGVPKLLDFGIAKLLSPGWSDDTGEATASMVRLMTPQYASPEQLRGLAITTASDVYSLGVVLYELLSGRHPYRLLSRRPEEVIEVILHEEPEKPSLAATQEREDAETRQASNRPPNPKFLRGDLDNIVLKALRKEPQRRYVSVQEFAEDIRRHLEGLPVTATPDTLSYRAGKFLQRHKAGVVAATAMVVTLFTATGITAWQARVARRERDNAEHRFNQVRKLAHSVLFDYHDDIAMLPGSTPVRQKMVKDVLEYLDNLAAESTGNRGLQAELATAYQKVGDVQGNPFMANLGNQDGALESYRKAFTIRESLAAQNSGDSPARFELARSYESIGDILWAKGESANSQTSYRTALGIYDELAKTKQLSDTASLERVYNRIGQTQEQTGNLDAALESYQAEMKAAETLIEGDPKNLKYRRALSISYAKIGDVYWEKHDYRQAAENYQNAVPILQKISAESTNQNALRNLGLIYARVALVEMEAANYSKAIAAGIQAIAIQRDIAAADPNNIQIHFDLADTLANLGEAYGRMGDMASATKQFQESLSIAKESLAKNSEYAYARVNLSNTHLSFAKLLLKNGNAAFALEHFRQARDILEQAKKESSEELADIYEGIADALFSLNHKAGKLSEVKAMYQKSLDVLQDLQRQGKLSTEYTGKLGTIANKLVKCADKLPE
jgi:serine/threonine protein kinase/tetratricopeptide (TPR) repeat protein